MRTKKERPEYLRRKYKVSKKPDYLCRSKKSGVLDDTLKPKFTRPETGKPCLI